jgi:hypothetical protein
VEKLFFPHHAVEKINFIFSFFTTLNHDSPLGFETSVEITSISYEAHLLSRSELLSFYSRIKRAGTFFIINRGARQAIPFIRLSLRGSSCGGA